MIGSRKFLLGAALAPLLVAQAAFAETKPASPGAADAAAPEGEIVVTATRNKSLESKTPISMQVYSGESLASKGITNVQSLATADTSVHINAGGGQPFISVRGVSTTDTTEVGDPAVPVSIDEFFTNRSYALNASLFDLNRIEVLRGPQGTLFGRNAVGGVLNMYTNDPSRDFGGYAQGEVGNYGTLNTTGALNLPLSDTLQVRVAVATNHHNGYRDLGSAGKGDDVSNQSGRIKIAWQPAPNLHVTASYQHVHVDDTGITEQSKSYVTFTDGSGNTQLDRTIRYSGNGRRFAVNFAPSEKITSDTFHWGATYDFSGGMSLHYLGGYDNTHWTRLTSQSAPAPAASKFPDAGFVQSEPPRTLNQELRLASSQDGALTWQVGGFYFHESNAINTTLHFNYNQPTDVVFLNFDYPTVRARSIAGYAQASYKFTPDLKFTAGVRYTSDKKEKIGGLDTLNLKAFAPFLPVIITPSSGSATSKVWTYHFGLDWQAAPRTLVYAHADKGYKAGGYNSGNAVPYRPEILYSYELGIKTKALDNHLALSVSGFYQDYRDQQNFTLVDPLIYGTTSIVENIGKSRIYGAEFSADLTFDPDTRIDFKGTILHARYKKYDTIDKVSGLAVDLAGNTLPNSPDLSLAGGIEHRFDTGHGTITPRVEVKYQSTEYFSGFNAADGRQKAFAIGNASLRYDDGDKRFSIEAFVRNIANKTYIVDFGENSDSALYFWGFGAPRTYGARVRVNF